MFNKKGVSLITVLMFMLVATIAATATFKWLTSENKSSASRMEIQEASQSAAAGIRSVRAWMTNNANEVGAVVSQYILGGKQPISLNSRVNVISNGNRTTTFGLQVLVKIMARISSRLSLKAFLAKIQNTQKQPS